MACTYKFYSNTYRKTKPFQRKRLFNRIIRVDHAGELGADKIYAGQLFALKDKGVSSIVRGMWLQEKDHLQSFEDLIKKYHVRPSALCGLWKIFGFSLGTGTALLGNSSAMTCTVAVEKVITDHYDSQIRELIEEHPSRHRTLLDLIKKYRDDEQHHHDTGILHGAENMLLYKQMSKIIEKGCLAAIIVAENI